MLELKRGKGKGGKKWCDHYYQTEFFRSASRLRCHSLRHPLARNRRWSITDKPRALKESLQFVVCNCFFIQAKQKGVLPIRRHGFVASPVMACMRVSFYSPTEILRVDSLSCRTRTPMDRSIFTLPVSLLILKHLIRAL